MTTTVVATSVKVWVAEVVDKESRRYVVAVASSREIAEDRAEEFIANATVSDMFVGFKATQWTVDA